VSRQRRRLISPATFKLFIKRCYECHGLTNKERLVWTKQDAFRGGNLAKPLVVPGQSSASELHRPGDLNPDEVMPSKASALRRPNCCARMDRSGRGLA
jgi:hypothetical protein